MPRSGRAQTQESRQRIVAAAGALFRSRGYEGVGIADVMRAAGMTQGGFYKHFASKEALAIAAWRAGFGKAADLWRQTADGPSPAEALIDAYFASRPAELCCPMLAHADGAALTDTDGALRETYRAGAEHLHETFSAITAGRIDGDQADLAFAAMVGAAMLARATGDAEWTVRLKEAVRRATLANSAASEPGDPMELQTRAERQRPS